LYFDSKQPCDSISIIQITTVHCQLNVDTQLPHWQKKNSQNQVTMDQQTIWVQSHLLVAQLHLARISHVPHLRSLTSHRSSKFIKSQHIIIYYKQIFKTSNKFKTFCNMLHDKLQWV